jgi:hypothetical protein
VLKIIRFRQFIHLKTIDVVATIFFASQGFAQSQNEAAPSVTNITLCDKCFRYLARLVDSGKHLCK